MYGVSFSCRLAKRLSSPQLSYLSKYRQIYTNSGRKIITTTVVQQTVDYGNAGDQPRRSLSMDSIKKVGSKDLNLQLQNIMKESKNILNTVKLADLQAAPQPAFWYGVGGLVPFALPVLSSLLLGYSPFLATAQLFYGATIGSFLGGVKWGHSVTENNKHPPTWENLGYAVMPQLVCWSGLLLPQALGFLFVSGGLLAAAYIDLTSSFYPPWFKSLRLFLTIPAVIFLLMTWFTGLFH